MGSQNWRFWKVFSGIPPWNNNPLIATMGAASLAAIFTTPPTLMKGDPDSLMAFLTHFDFDRDAPKIYAKGSFAIDGKTIDYQRLGLGIHDAARRRRPQARDVEGRGP